MWKIIHLNSGHTLVTEDNIDLTKPVITANVLDHETGIALHAISGELLENVFYPMTYRPPIRRTEYRVANPERIQAFLSATNRVSIPLGSVDTSRITFRPPLRMRMKTVMGEPTATPSTAKAVKKRGL